MSRTSDFQLTKIDTDKGDIFSDKIVSAKRSENAIHWHPCHQTELRSDNLKEKHEIMTQLSSPQLRFYKLLH